jgi:hypothetical protein
MTSFLSNSESFTAMLKGKKFFYFFIFVLYLIVTSLINADYITLLKNVGELLVLFSPMLFLSYYLLAKQISVLKIIIIISGLFYLFISLQAMIYYSNNPDAGRIIASDRFALDTIAIGGGYGLAYGSALLAVYFMDVYRSSILKSKTHNVLLIVIIIFLSTLVINTRSTITIIFLFFGFIFSILFKHKSQALNDLKILTLLHRMRRIIVVLILTSVSLVIFNKEIGSSMINNFSDNDNVVFKRFQEIGLTMVDDDLNDEGTMQIRLLLILKSISAFISNPIFGQGWEFGYSFELSRNYIGNHSEWFDTLGKYGILGSIPFFLIFKRSIKEDLRRTGRFIPKNYLIVFFFLGLFNPFQTFQSMYVLFFIIPTIGLLVVRKNQL